METSDIQWNPNLYNDKHAFVYAFGESLLELLQPQSHERILDLGCGSGQLTAKIKEYASEVVGIDKSADMIADARQKYPQVDFHVADAADFCLDQPFDAIFSNAALHWVTDYKGAIRCMWENLVDEGRIVIEMGGKNNVQTIVSQLRAALDKRGYTTQAQFKQWYFPSIGEYTYELEKQGFHVTWAHHFDRPTELADEAAGIKDWLTMFGESFFKGVDPVVVEMIKDEVQQEIKPKCFKDGKWYADYKRLRIIAIKER